MEDIQKTYRIRTEVGNDAPNVIQVPLNQTYDMFEILSLKLSQINEYKTFDSNYGCIVGRVIANNGFGVPNAKVSIFIEVDATDSFESKLLYNYRSVSSLDDNNVRYNVLPDYIDDDCHQDVGTLPNKRLLLDNDDLIEVFDKYWKYTTTTNNAGDYMLFNVPTGMQQLHVDIDLSDCGILSQRPRDMIAQGYNTNMFESPNKFKKSNNLDALAQIISQDKGLYVYPYWGDTSETNETIGITRCDINIEYKFEPTCIFIGSIITDKGDNAIGKNCTANPNAGKMSEMSTGEGTIEMIRKTIDGKVESFPIEGNRLIDDDGVWCYQIPMNLDIVKTDEFGNLVPTDDPNKGIATRARVRFRISLDEQPGDVSSRKRCRYLVPNNPRLNKNDYPDFYETHEADYEFGTNTKDESYANLFWNCVYTVKNYIPRLQKDKLSYNNKNTAIKQIKYFGGNNPLPYNALDVKLTFMHQLLCVLTKFIIQIIAFLNMIITVIAYLPCTVCSAIEGIAKALNSFKILHVRPLRPVAKVFEIIAKPFCAICELFECISLTSSFCEDSSGIKKTYYPGCNQLGFISSNTWKRIKKKHEKEKDPEKVTQPDSKPNFGDFESTRSTLYSCVENSLAQSNEATSFMFQNDWINGTLYAPLWHRKIRRKKKMLFGLIRKKAKDQWCREGDNFNLKLYQHNSLERKIAGREESGYEQTTSPISIYSRVGDSGKKTYRNIQFFPVNNGLIVTRETMLGQTVYYYKSVFYTEGSANVNIEKAYDKSNKGAVEILYATDIVLLGSLNPCDLQGIPQFFKFLEPSTYNMPSDLEFVDTQFHINDDGTYSAENPDVITEETGCDWSNLNEQDQCGRMGSSTDGGLFYNVDCSDVNMSAKTSVNLRRICELGVSLDASKYISNLEKLRSDDDDDARTATLVPDGFVSYDELYGFDERSMFATMNGNRLRTRINSNNGLTEYDFRYLYCDNFDGALEDIMKKQQSSCNVTYKNNYQLEKPSFDYYTFRMGERPYFYDGDKKINDTRNSFPRYENSFYFYFGLKNGKTAIEKFNSKFFAPCANDEGVTTPIKINYKANSWCSEVGNNTPDGYTAFDLSDITPPYSIAVNNEDNYNVFYAYDNVNYPKIYFGDNNALDAKGYEQLDEVNFINGEYNIIIVDADGNIVEDKFSTNSTKLNYLSSTTIFEYDNKYLLETFTTPDNIAAAKMNEVQFDPLTNTSTRGQSGDIGGVITLYGFSIITTEEADNNQIMFDVSIAVSDKYYNKIPDFMPQKTRVTGTYQNNNWNWVCESNDIIKCKIYQIEGISYPVIIIGVPMGGIAYEVTVTQICDGEIGIETKNTRTVYLTVNEPLPFALFVNGVDSDLLKKFKSGWQVDGTINNPLVFKSPKFINNQWDISGWDNINKVWTVDNQYIDDAINGIEFEYNEYYQNTNNPNIILTVDQYYNLPENQKQNYVNKTDIDYSYTIQQQLPWYDIKTNDARQIKCDNIGYDTTTKKFIQDTDDNVTRLATSDEPQPKGIRLTAGTILKRLSIYQKTDSETDFISLEDYEALSYTEQNEYHLNQDTLFVLRLSNTNKTIAVNESVTDEYSFNVNSTALIEDELMIEKTGYYTFYPEKLVCGEGKQYIVYNYGMAPENYDSVTIENTHLNEISPENTFTEDVVLTENCTATFNGTGNMFVFKKVNNTDNYQLIKKLETSDNNISNRIIELQWSSYKIMSDKIRETSVGSYIAPSDFGPTSGSNDPFAISETIALNAGDVVYYTPSITSAGNLSAIIKADGEYFWERDVKLVAKFNSNSEQAFIIEEQGLYCFMYKGNTTGLPILKANSIEPNIVSLNPGTYIFGPQANIENVYINYTLLNGEKESIVYDGSKLQELFNELTNSEPSDVPYTYIRNYLYEDCDFDTFKNYKDDNLEKQREVIEGLNSVILNRQQLPALMLNAFYLTSLEKPLPLEVILQTNHLPAGYTTVYNEEQMDTSNEVFVEKTSKKIINQSTIQTFIGKPTYENRGGIEQIFTPTISYKGSPLYDNDKNENYPINGQIIPANVKAETYEEFSARTPYLIGATDFKKSTKPEDLNVVKADNKYEISTQTMANKFLPIHIIDKIFMPQVTMWSNINQIPLYYPAGTSKMFSVATKTFFKTYFVLTKRGFVSFNVYNGVISSEKNNYVNFVTQEINGKQFKILRNQQDDEERFPVRRTLINDASKLTTVRNYVIPDDSDYLNFKGGNNTDSTYAMNIPSRDFDIELTDEKGDSAFIDSFDGDFKIELLEDSSYRGARRNEGVLNFTTNASGDDIKFYMFALPAVFGKDKGSANHYENTRSYPLNAFYDYYNSKAFDAIPKIILKEPEKYYTLKAGETAPSGYGNAITKEERNSLSSQDKLKYEFSQPEIGINEYYMLSSHQQSFYNAVGNRLYIEDAWEFKEDGSDVHNFFSVKTTPDVLKKIATKQDEIWHGTRNPEGEVIYYDTEGNEIETKETCYSNTGNFNTYNATNGTFVVAVNKNGQRAISPVYDLKVLTLEAECINMASYFQLEEPVKLQVVYIGAVYRSNFVYSADTYDTTIKIYENDDEYNYMVYPYYLAKYEFKCETINPNGDNYTSIISPEMTTVHEDSDEVETYIEFNHEGLVNEETQVNITDVTKLKHECTIEKAKIKDDEQKIEITWVINYNDYSGNKWEDGTTGEKTTYATITYDNSVTTHDHENFGAIQISGCLRGAPSGIEGWKLGFVYPPMGQESQDLHLSTSELVIQDSPFTNVDIHNLFEEVFKIYHNDTEVSFLTYYEDYDDSQKAECITPFNQNIKLVFYAAYYNTTTSTGTIKWSLNNGYNEDGTATEVYDGIFSKAKWNSGNWYYQNNKNPEIIVKNDEYNSLSSQGDYHVYPSVKTEVVKIINTEDGDRIDRIKSDYQPAKDVEVNGVEIKLLGFSSEKTASPGNWGSRYYIIGNPHIPDSDINELGRIKGGDNLIFYAIWDVPRRL